MNLIKKTVFEKVEAIQLGYGPVGPPLMTVFMYVVDGLVIDTGQRNMKKVVIELLKQRKLSRILLTHHHEDHSGNAFALASDHRIPVNAHPLSVEKMHDGFKILTYQRYVWGKAEAVVVTPFAATIETDNFKFRPVHTPGHSKDHTVYLEEENGWLFSGDLYLADRIKYFRSDEILKDQISSLKKVLQLDFEVLFCAHNPSLENGKSRLKNKLQFLEEFCGQVQQLVQKGLSEREVVKKLDPKKDRLVRWITTGNISCANMVRSAINAT
jgi:glyoxylase-like metal-dependent hydrolase (beta-lactamase superfamily II)